MNHSSHRLDGQTILVTGVSRPLGIGATLTKRLAQAGATVAIHGFSDYDLHVGHKSATQHGTEIVAKQLSDLGLKVTALTPCDLLNSNSAEKIVEEATANIGTLSGLILNHAYSTCEEIGSWTSAEIDKHLLVNVRASMMMLQAFDSQVDTRRDNAVTLFTSGQYLGPMSNEIAYCVSKDAIIGLCKQTAYLLGDKNIRVNCINPGPNDTGYCFGNDHKAVAKRFPAGRWGTPDDTADLILFLHSADAKWITGQVIASEGGFKRY